MLKMRLTIILAGMLALTVTACGGGGGGGLASGTPPDPAPQQPDEPAPPTPPTTQPAPPTPPTTQPAPPSPPPPANTPREVTGKSLVPVVAAQASTEDILDMIGAVDHAPGRKKIAENMELGSMTQSSRDGFSAGIDVRGSNIIGDDGLFTITSSFDWETDEGVTCNCSLNYFAGFYDAKGYGVMYMGGNNPTPKVSAPLLYPEVKHGFLMGYYYQGREDFGVFVDATPPTTTLRKFGTAKYRTHIFGFMTGLEPNSHVEMGTRMTMTATWGDSPSLSGRINGASGHQVSVDINGVTSTNYYHYYVSAVLSFHGTDWSEEDMAFKNGNIDCVTFCVASNESRSKWGALLMNNGSGGIDPFMLVGTFGLYQYNFGGKLVDWIGFVAGENQMEFEGLGRGFTPNPRSPGHALIRRVGVELSEEVTDGALDFLATVNSNALGAVIYEAATINTSRYGDLDLYVDYSQGSPTYARAYVDFHDYYGAPRGFVGGQPASTPRYGNASYAGVAGGLYRTSAGDSGAFVSTIDIGVYFGPVSPSLRGTLGYDFNGVIGKLSLSGGTWNSRDASFNNGRLGCVTGCMNAGTFARWSSQFIDVTGERTSSLAAPEGVIGKFGVTGLQQQGIDELLYDMYGIFSAVDNTMTAPRPAYSTFFPATPHGMISDDVGIYHRHKLHLFQKPFTGFSGSMYDYTNPTVVKSPERNFVHSGGTVQLASDQWDWRSGDYGNCYCTMFLTGTAYDGDGKEIKGGLSSDPRQRWDSVDYSDAKFGWVGGMWRLDVVPDEWRRYGGRSQLGIFVDGTPPSSLPSSGSAYYKGYGTGYAVPSTSTMVTDYKTIQSRISLDVDWDSGGSPAISGKIGLAGNFSHSTIWTGVTMTMGTAQWSASDKKFRTGSLGCFRNCAVRAGTEGSWEGLFVEIGDGQLDPGLFAGAYAMTRVSIWKYHVYNTSTTYISQGYWDLFGWFNAVPSSSFDYERELLRMPYRAVQAAIQDGFDVIYYNATSGQRQDALVAAGHSTIQQSWREAPRSEEFGKVNMSDGGPKYSRTGFWTTTNRNVLSLGMYNTGSQSGALPRTGSARYKGNAVGFYASNTNSNVNGVMLGEVAFNMQFNGGTITVSGNMDFDIDGSLGSFRMDHTLNSTRFVRHAEMTCRTGCVGGSGRWGGHFTETEAGRPAHGTPGGFIGSFGLDGIVFEQKGEYDVLGAFSTVKQ